MVQVYGASSNLLEPQQHRKSKVCRGLSQELAVVRLYRTFSDDLFTGEKRCAGCLSTGSGWFKKAAGREGSVSSNLRESLGGCVQGGSTVPNL